MHTIRLRYPWSKQLHDGESDARRVNVPERDEDLSSAEQRHSTTYTRHFNRPTGIESGDRVALRITNWQGQLTSIRLNGKEQPTGPPPLEIELTEQWDLHNQIELQLDPSGGVPVRLDGEVTLEIRTSDQWEA
ncbi:hypothetical protein Pla52o_01900 [Novipirellula galeiformis]|uniref:Uncharacterized protein n=1 Tax=Novipirellula galeiformis TaxID=2528004 RepID=A0A5C6CS21_9BACT|nr:hypothetical protein [Novipirellula galeiformis]TWU26337.1 hypothetical protein Pla52o_01900 [Novipirellula galeiformis]